MSHPRVQFYDEGEWTAVPGWYFADEADRLIGPFDTETAATEYADQYIRSLR